MPFIEDTWKSRITASVMLIARIAGGNSSIQRLRDSLGT